jgi:hypothetical protein
LSCSERNSSSTAASELVTDGAAAPVVRTVELVATASADSEGLQETITVEMMATIAMPAVVVVV